MMLARHNVASPSATPLKQPRCASAAQTLSDCHQQEEGRKRGLLDLGFVEDGRCVDRVHQGRRVANGAISEPAPQIPDQSHGTDADGRLQEAYQEEVDDRTASTERRAGTG